jgi:hypothetical protein
MFNKYGTIGLILTACILVGVSSKSHAIDAKSIYDSCQSENTRSLCVGYFVGVADAHVTTMITLRKVQGLDKCKKWKRFSPKMLIASFELEYTSEDSEFTPDQDPSFWLLSEVYDKAGCQNGIEA